MSKECPSCGESFKTRKGMFSHHGKAHPGKWEETLWMKIDMGSDDECWEWTGSLANGGNGIVRVEGEQMTAHKAAYISQNGEPEGSVGHTCENGACCNPRHLYDTGDR